MDGRRNVRHGLVSQFDHRRRRLCALPNLRPLGTRRKRRLDVGQRLRLGLHPIPLRPLGLDWRKWLGMDSWPRIRPRMGELAHDGLWLRRLGTDGSVLVLVWRISRQRLVHALFGLRLLPVDIRLPPSRAHVRRA